ncbi:hypothetical protein KY285_028110 [Solanum tuberosum]|nr:hypothetical protein KY285_028110 [Solanum tuberosum]
MEKVIAGALTELVLHMVMDCGDILQVLGLTHTPKASSKGGGLPKPYKESTISLTTDVGLLSFFNTPPHAQCLASGAWAILILGVPTSGLTHTPKASSKGGGLPKPYKESTISLTTDVLDGQKLGSGRIFGWEIFRLAIHPDATIKELPRPESLEDLIKLITRLEGSNWLTSGKDFLRWLMIERAYRLNQVDFVVDDHVSGDEEEGTVVELRTVDENLIGGSSSEEALHQVHDVKVDEDLPEREDLLLEEAQSLDNSTSDEPFVGLEFESEAAAHAFYNAYATRVGFIIRVSKLSRSRRDGSAIGRALVCNKEGFRMPDKREKIVRQRAETRVGCRAMILVRKISSGKWVVTKFVKEHSHPLCPGKGRRDLIYDQYPNEHDKIRELSQQLAAEKKRSATYKRHLEMIFEHIEEHNQSLSKKIQDIVHNVRELESRDQHHHR